MDHTRLFHLLSEYGIRPLRARGQHFLLDDAVVSRMLDAAGIVSGDCVVEIGPGPGILTEALLDRGARVTAVELDPALLRMNHERFSSRGLTLIHADARHVSHVDLVQTFGGNAPYKIVTNLPYGITSEIIVKTLREAPLPVSVTMMIQREVADRILAKPPHMSALAVTVQTLSQVSRVVNVPAGSFYPPPKVDSSVIHMVPITAYDNADTMLRIAHTAFAQKRKQIANTLRSIASSDILLQACSVSGVDASRRPETLSVHEWHLLTKALTA